MRNMYARVQAAFVLFACAIAVAGAPVEYNRDVRPILSDKCFACHGPDAANRKTKLRLDTETGARIDLRGGRKALVPGSPEASEIYRRITTDNKALRMPPAHSGQTGLTVEETLIIQNWIRDGARWQSHWSFLPPKKSALPADFTATHPVDSFILSRLAREGLRPSPEVDKRTLLRRVTYDLTGLPPSPAEVQAFMADPSSSAFETEVNRLLASPRYAERMAFRWMEAARYADTNGYQSDGVRDMWRWRDWVIDAYARNMPFDQFTVEQIAGDLLPNPTLDQRIATAFNRNHRTSAEGGIVPEEFRTEYVADRAETTATVWLGLTVGCARCHDHKYDPIPQKDFYRLFAFFNNVPEKGLVYNWGNDEPLIKAPTPPQAQELAVLNERVRHAEEQWSQLADTVDRAERKWQKKAKKAPDWTVSEGLVFRLTDGSAPGTVVAGCKSTQPCELPLTAGPSGQARIFDGIQYLQAGADVANFDYLQPFTFAAWVKPDRPDGAILSHDQDYAEGSGHGLHLMNGKLRLHVVFRWTDIGMRVETAEPLQLNRWQHVSVTYDGKRYASGVHMYVDGRPVALKVLFDELNWPMNFKVPFRIGAGSGLRFTGAIADARVYNRELTPEQASVIALTESVSQIARSPRSARSAAADAKLRMTFLETAAPSAVREALGNLRTVRATRDKFEASLPTVMVMREGPVRTAHILKRGAYDQPGDPVTPGVLSALPQLPADAPQNRLGLARWLVDRSNPLTARVTVNRLWQMLFGTGLVKSVDDFGSQGEWPVHPELLDYLAVEFMDSGWDVKHMLKLMVTSATYRQSSRLTPELIAKDPENRLLARGPRLRLGPETIRDGALLMSGLLVEKTGGPSVKPYQPPGLWQELAGGKGYEPDKGEGLYRRSLYTFWKRTVAPPFMVNFDSPNREVCTVRESRTNTPLQALNLMNDLTFVEASRKLGERMMTEGGTSDGQRIAHGFELVLGRDSRPEENAVIVQALQHFRKKYAADSRAAAQMLSHGASQRQPGLEDAQAAAWTAVASLMLNLDEAVTRE